MNFLFPAPFGRRELLAYKLALGFVFSLPTTLFMTFVFQIYAHSFLVAFIGLLLTYQFMQLFVTAVNLAASAGGARLFTFGRRAAAVGAAVLVGAIAWQAGLAPGRGGAAGAGQGRQNGHLADGFAPLRYFFDAFLSENLWPDLAWNALLALAVDLVLLAVVFGLDAHYLEASASVSARIYARIQRMRRVGPSAARGGKALLRPADGAVVGRRRPDPVAAADDGHARGRPTADGDGDLRLAMTAVWTGLENEKSSCARRSSSSSAALMMTFLTTLAPFDFRGDVDQMALLKTLPTPAWRLALGRCSAPVLIFTLIQWAALGAMIGFSGRTDPLLPAVAAFAPVYNFVLFGTDNLLFLLFPTRVMVTTPGDFQAMGRNVLAQFAKALGVGGAAVGGRVGGRRRLFC